MKGNIVHHAMLFFSCLFLMSGTTNAAKTQIKGSQKLYHQQNQDMPQFPSSIQRDTASDNIPIVNPTTPGTTPIVNPTTPGTTPTINPPSPIPPTTTGPNPTGPNPTGPNPTGPVSSGGSWCIANPSASQTALQVALDYACGYGGTDCSAIQPNGACWEPNTVADHASYAFNDYYQKNPVPTSCVFGGAAQISTTDPSHGSCRFAAANTTPTTPPSMPTTPPAMPTTEPPPSPTMASPYAPGGDNGSIDGDYGAEPTGEPSSAQTIRINLITICSIVMPLAMASHV